MSKAVLDCYIRGKELMNCIQEFLKSKGFTEDTLNLLKFESLSLLAAEYLFEK